MKTFVQSPQRRQKGAATVVVLALLSIVLLYLGINAHSVSNLQRELKVLEKEQIKRLSASVTNSVSKVTSQSVTR
jgi:cell division protein FtsB